MTTKTKYLVALTLITVIDILPVPILGMLAFYIILKTPPWFLNTVTKLYRESEANDDALRDPN